MLRSFCSRPLASSNLESLRDIYVQRYHHREKVPNKTLFIFEDGLTPLTAEILCHPINPTCHVHERPIEELPPLSVLHIKSKTFYFELSEIDRMPYPIRDFRLSTYRQKCLTKKGWHVMSKRNIHARHTVWLSVGKVASIIGMPLLWATRLRHYTSLASACKLH